MANNGGLNPNSAVQDAVNSTTGGSAYPGICDHFVANMYGFSSSGFASATAHWAQTPANIKHPGDQRPPIGALVFFATGKPAGHVAIVTGYGHDGQPLVTTTHTNNGQPRTMTLAQVGMTYQGWAQPYFGGKTVALKPVTPQMYGKNAVVNTDLRAGDMTGIDANTNPNVSMVPDKLSPKVLAAQYGYALRVMKSDHQVWQLFQTAVNDHGAQWTTERFNAELMNTNWWKQNNEYARAGLTAQALGGADWELRKQKALDAVRAEATSIGANIDPDKINTLVDNYIMQGWDKRPDGQQILQRELANSITADKSGHLAGSSGSIEADLRQTAMLNGLHLDDSYFVQAAQAVARGEKTADDFKRDVRSQAASMWPGWSDKINAGVDARSLASGYINTMAQTLEMDPNSIDLNDPLLRGAMTQVDPKTGEPNMQSLYNFQQTLRKDPRWMNTQQATDSIANIGSSLMKMFGFQGA